MAKFEVSREFDVEDIYGELGLDKMSQDGSGDRMTNKQKHSLENYSDADKAADKLLLEMKDVSKKYIELRDSDIAKESATVSSNRSVGYSYTDRYDAANDRSKLATRLYYSEEEAKKKPEIIRAEAKARLDYCNKMTAILQKMLQLNYKGLNLSVHEAQAIGAAMNSSGEGRQSAIAAIKAAITANEKKFATKYGYDFGPIGGGKVSTDQNIGEASRNLIPVNRMVQDVLEYDLIVFSHGTAGNKTMTKILNATSKFNKEFAKENIAPNFSVDRYAKFVGEVTDLVKMVKNDKSITRGQKEQILNKMKKTIMPMYKYALTVIDGKATKAEFTKNEIEKLTKLTDTISKIYSDDMESGEFFKDNDERWLMSTVIGPWGKEYNDMINYVEDAIKHGFKKIKIVSCNPGHVDIRKVKSIAKAKDVKISFATSTIGVTEVADIIRGAVSEYNGKVIDEGAKSILASIGKALKFCWEKIKALFSAIKNMVVKLVRGIAKTINKLKDKFKEWREKRKGRKTRHLFVSAKDGKVHDAKTENPEKGLAAQKNNIATIGTVVDKMLSIQKVAFDQYMKLVDKLERDARELEKLGRVDEAARILHSLTGGSGCDEDEEISKDYLRDRHAFA